MISELKSLHQKILNDKFAEKVTEREILALVWAKNSRGNVQHESLVQTCNKVDLDILIQWCRMAHRELIIEDGRIIEVISIE